MKKRDYDRAVPPLIAALRCICAKYPREEKVLITPDYRVARQTLQALAKSGTPWMNFRTAAVSALAHDIAEEDIISRGLRQIAGPGILAVIDDIFNGLAGSGQLRYFERHQTNTGINHALTGIIMELRSKGITASGIKPEDMISEDKGRDIRLILAGYEDFLRKNALIDKAGLMMLAMGRLREPFSPPDRKYIIFSRYYMSGVEKDLIRALAGEGLMVIEDGQVFGLKGPKGVWEKALPVRRTENPGDIERLSWLHAPREAPAPLKDGTIDMFSAIGFRNEIREIFRIMVRDNIPCDQVEIVYTDRGVYADEIFCLCEKNNIPVTFSEGVPVSTMSPFRAITGFLKWIKHDLMEIHLRRILEGEDMRLETLRVPDSEGAALGHFLRISGVGWGRGRYMRVLEKKAAEYLRKAERPVSEEESERYDEYVRASENTRKLGELCRGLLALVPETDEAGKVDVPLLCEGCIGFLERYARVTGNSSGSFVSEAVSRLAMIGQFGAERLDLDEAAEKLIGTISTLRTGASGPRPGHVHVSYYKQGGRSARANTFIVGLDESRFPGRGLQDPILLDVERKRISPEMEVSTDRIRQNVYDMAGMLAGLRGRVTASFTAFDIGEEKKQFPAAVMLDIYRLKEGTPDADYAEMGRSLGQPVSTTNSRGGNVALDMTEWWISVLSEDGLIKNGMEAVKKVYPGIRGGLKAKAARESPDFTEYDGKVNAGPGELDPRENNSMVLSSSRLEAAAGCPYKYFLSSVLGVEKPEETVKDPAMWLDPMQKGSLLHEVFENYTKELRGRGGILSTAERKGLMEITLNRIAKKYRDDIPPPNDVVYEGEYIQMERDVDIFLSINEQLGTCCIYEELAFGTGRREPVAISLGGGGKIMLRGIIDRIDRAGEHEYHVWDYKTGSAYKYENNQYVKGGEMLQHALYAAAAEILLKSAQKDKAPSVTRSGYLLPSEKGFASGKGGIFGRDPSKKDVWQRALNTLLDIISSGGFFISDEAQCSFCDYSCICGDKAAKDRSRAKKDSGDRSLELWKELKLYE